MNEKRQPEEAAPLEERIRELEGRLADARARLPKHTPPVAIFVQIDELEQELARLRQQRDQE